MTSLVLLGLVPMACAPRALAQAVPAAVAADQGAADQGAAGPGAAVTAGAGAATELPQVDVISSTPLLGSGIDKNKVPSAVSVLNSADLSRTGNPSLLNSMNQQVPGLTLDSASGNPYQPNLLYHGYQASPLQGNSQGLAVYLNGVRFNQAFGDTVNWDLLPSIAIDRVNVEGSNPVFGLNALGGSISVQTKNGFTYQGAEGILRGGSFGTVEGQFQYGVQHDDTAAYIAGDVLHSGGWRDGQSSDIYNIFGDIGWRGENAELHINVVAADDALNGPGTSPVQLLQVNPALQFTAPNYVANKYLLLSANGNVQLATNTTLQSVAYYSNFQQKIINGNVSNFAPCTDGSNNLCDSNGNYALDRSGSPITAFLGSDPTSYSVLNLQSTNTNGYGASAQVSNHDDIFGFHNHLVAGVSYDGSYTMFSALSEVGGQSALTRVFGGPYETVGAPQADGGPVGVGITDNYGGLFITDTFDVTDRLSLTAAGRFNLAQIDLADQVGTALNGNHSYNHFNPSLGGTYRITHWLSAYASFAVSNRAPTPAELSCAGPTAPCSLANFFVGDPNLKQVVSQTYEVGLRGDTRLTGALDGAKLSYNLDLYRSDLSDDIIFVNSPQQGLAFFRNVGNTQRQGIDAAVQLKNDRWLYYVNYSYTDATFQSGFTESSQNNPGADASGNITVRPGNVLPGIPAHLLKFGVNYNVTDKWTVGLQGIAASGQYLFGDEANLQPKLPGYVVLNLDTSYQLTDHIAVFGQIENLGDQRYYTFGTFSPTSSVYLAQAPGATNPRSYSPAAPIGGYAGVRVTF